MIDIDYNKEFELISNEFNMLMSKNKLYRYGNLDLNVNNDKKNFTYGYG